ncbi:MAG: serine/threonine-protein kinase [Candidatus Eisenbacteria bacterium]
MAHCPHCSTPVPSEARFCPGCGAIQSSVSQMPTAVAPPTPSGASTPSSGSGGARSRPGTPLTGTIGRLESSANFASAAFQPGQLLAGRYRVIGLLGRGGMGDVYRADDIELSQAVSLKFLGATFAGRPDMLERFRGEVRNARQVSHPNICRVYDIGEVDGQVFLSMEYVDGEDLSTLLKRIGRLPRGKAEEVARQLCAGIAAAHDRGVIHRDLKPSNVMIDGEGRVRITDFGLAVQTADGIMGEVVGTPAYMAPEQFEGKPATAQTDLYALGLILYEIYTGRRPLEATTWDGWKSQHSQVEPRSPEEIERDVEEPVARAILRCLEKDPGKRPRSALQLAASLPGGDPIAAALAAGEMPSPQMVAASGGHGATSSRTGFLLLGAFLVMLAGYLAIAPAATDMGLAPFTRGHDALLVQARDIVHKLGYTEAPRDQATWFERDYDPMVWRAQRESSTHWRHDYAAHGTPLRFWYRSSPAPLQPLGGARVNAEDPIPIAEGMVTARLDAEGRLRNFVAVPGRVDTLPPSTAATHLADLFAFAELDTARFREVPPRWRPLLPFDLRREWEGERADQPGVPLRVTAAWWRGKPVTFGVRGPWDEPAALQTVRRANPISGVTRGLIVFALTVLCIASGTARLKTGKSDWRGGLRFVNVIMILSMANWIFGAHHSFVPGAEFGSAMRAFGQGLVSGFIMFFLYLVIEPEIRRRTPELLIGWARLLQGRWTDPRVGHDVLVGCVVGAASSCGLALVNAIPTWLPFQGQTPVPPNTDVITGGALLFAQFTAIPLNVVGTSFALFGVWFMLWLGTRRMLLSAIAFAVVMTLLALGAENPTLEVPGAILDGILIAYVISRHGLLSLLAVWTTRLLMQGIPAPFTPTSPFAFSAFVAIVVPVVLAVMAFRVGAAGGSARAGAGTD